MPALLALAEGERLKARAMLTRLRDATWVPASKELQDLQGVVLLACRAGKISLGVQNVLLFELHWHTCSDSQSSAAIASTAKVF